MFQQFNVQVISLTTSYIAAFLIGGNNFYFGCGNWNAAGNDTRLLTWRSKYGKPLGKSAGVYNSQTGDCVESIVCMRNMSYLIPRQTKEP